MSLYSLTIMSEMLLGFEALFESDRLRAIVCKIQANGESDHLRIGFFSYVRDVHERKLTKKFFFKNFIPYSFYGHVKLPSATIRFRNLILKANFEIIFWEKP